MRRKDGLPKKKREFPTGAAAKYPPITDRDRHTFRREWKRGTLLKIIGQMLDPQRTARALAAWRLRLNLPVRQPKGVKRLHRGPSPHVNFELDAEMLRFLQQRASGEGTTMSMYIRRLIRRDMGSEF